MKRISLSAVVVLAMQISCFSQESLELSVFGSPTFSYRLVTGDPEFRKLLKDIHDPTFRYEMGVLATLKKKSRMNFQAGFTLSRSGYSFKSLALVTSPNMDPLINSDKISLSVDFLQIPFRLNYYFSEAKKNYLISGISADILLKAKYQSEEGESNNFLADEPTNMRKLNFSLQVGYGYKLVDSEKFGLDLQPNFKLQLLDANKNTETINMHFYSIGLACLFRFKV